MGGGNPSTYLLWHLSLLFLLFLLILFFPFIFLFLLLYLLFQYNFSITVLVFFAIMRCFFHPPAGQVINFHLKAKILEPPLSTAMITDIYCMCTYDKTELYVHLILHGAYYCPHFIEHKVKAIEFKQLTQDHSAGGKGRVRSQTQVFLTPQLIHT